MPTRKRPTLSLQDLNGGISIGRQSIEDARVAFALWRSNKSNSHARILIRTFVVALEAYYSETLYRVELNQLLFRTANHLDEYKTSYIDLVFKSSEIDNLYVSRSNALNASRLRETIKLVEKAFITEKFDFGNGNNWLAIRDVFEKRNDFTHPRNHEDFSADEIDYLVHNGIKPLLEHVSMLNEVSKAATLEAIKECSPHIPSLTGYQR